MNFVEHPHSFRGEKRHGATQLSVVSEVTSTIPVPSSVARYRVAEEGPAIGTVENRGHGKILAQLSAINSATYRPISPEYRCAVIAVAISRAQPLAPWEISSDITQASLHRVTGSIAENPLLAVREGGGHAHAYPISD